ncbi:MAG: polysaccharide deacetylase family protein [Coriobacteriaceae bacterium]|nr:polysaccharide deacetylase family protein [Coriobacteriaceae bacterium]
MNNKPRYRKGPSRQLPNARGRQQQRRRKDAQYLRHTQGFGGGRRPGRGYGGNDRRPYAIIMVGCAFLLFAASIVWYVNRGVEITLNGEPAKVRIHSTIEQAMAEHELTPSPGDLLAVDDEVLKRDGGTKCTVTLNGKAIAPGKLGKVELEGGEKLTVEDGKDVYEKHDVAVTELMPKMSVKGAGPVRYVETWGEAGRSEIWTGHTSGKVVDKGIVKEPVDAVVSCTGVNPARKKGVKYVALTFDESPSTHTQEILEILEKKDAKATFFIAGDKVKKNAAAVQAIAKSGNELGTNAYADKDLTELSGEDLRAQITRASDAVENVTGSAVPLLRPPFGEFSPDNWAQAMDLVSAVVTWTIDSGDWLQPGAGEVVDTVTSSVSNGDIVLFTDSGATGAQLVEALPQVIDTLQSQGYKLVTLSELIATDKDLSKKLDLGRAGLPKGKTLPSLGEDKPAE